MCVWMSNVHTGSLALFTIRAKSMLSQVTCRYEKNSEVQCDSLFSREYYFAEVSEVLAKLVDSECTLCTTLVDSECMLCTTLVDSQCILCTTLVDSQCTLCTKLVDSEFLVGISEVYRI